MLKNLLTNHPARKSLAVIFTAVKFLFLLNFHCGLNGREKCFRSILKTMLNSQLLDFTQLLPD